MIVQLVTSSLLVVGPKPRERERPRARQKDVPRVAGPSTGEFAHSKKPSAGIRHRVEANASLNAFVVSTVSMRALNIAALGVSFAHQGLPACAPFPRRYCAWHRNRAESDPPRYTETVTLRKLVGDAVQQTWL